MQENISLKDLTTFRIGGKAKYFRQTNNKEEVVEAINWAEAKRMPFFVLGGGSNVLINDKRYKGLVIRIQESGIRNQESGIEVGAGVPLGKLVGVALQNSLTGMEWAMGIPGTVGGAIHGNAGAFGKSIGDVVEEVEVIDFRNQELGIRNYEKEECNFSYRDSLFKKDKNLIILSAKIKLQKGNKIEIEEKMADFFKIKKQTQPLEFFSAGSVFKNQELGIKPSTRAQAEGNQELLKQFPELKQFQDKNIIPVAWLIEKAGLKGKRIGGVEISRKHSNFIVNNGRGKARDIKKLIDLTKKTVKKKFGVDLEEEIQYLGF